MKSHPVRCEASHELPHSLQQGMSRVSGMPNRKAQHECQIEGKLKARGISGVSRRSLLQSMSLLLLPAAPSYAQEAGPTAQLAAADTAQTASTALSGIPAVLEGEAKQAVEQALRKSVEKNKVGNSSLVWCKRNIHYAFLVCFQNHSCMLSTHAVQHHMRYGQSHIHNITREWVTINTETMGRERDLAYAEGCTQL